MKVKAVLNYYDKELKKDITVGEILDVTKERAEVLLKGNTSSNNKPFVKVVKEKKVKEEKEEVCNQEQ